MRAQGASMHRGVPNAMQWHAPLMCPRTGNKTLVLSSRPLKGSRGSVLRLSASWLDLDVELGA